MKSYKLNFGRFWDSTGIVHRRKKLSDILDDFQNKFEDNAGSHNSIYRGKNITDYFYGRESYNGKTFSEAVADGTFDNIFVGDYIIGKESGIKYLIADLDYRLGCGDAECTKHHALVVPENLMGTAKMNDTNITTGAYINSKMYTEYLTPFKIIIQNDFKVNNESRILSHRTWLTKATTNGYESDGEWRDSTIELMNELMVYGSNIFHNVINGTNMLANYTIDKAQLSLFRLDKSKIVTKNADGTRNGYKLRDVASSMSFAVVDHFGNVSAVSASTSGGVRPAFLIY